MKKKSKKARAPPSEGAFLHEWSLWTFILSEGAGRGCSFEFEERVKPEEEAGGNAEWCVSEFVLCIGVDCVVC